MPAEFSGCRALLPLGCLAPSPDDDQWPPAALFGSVGGVEEELRTHVASYLRAGTIFFAWMEYTRDVVGDAFGVSGGSAVLSDGRFYWRADAAEYVETYGIAIPVEAIDHMRSRQWIPPIIAEGSDEYLEIYNEITRLNSTSWNTDELEH